MLEGLNDMFDEWKYTVDPGIDDIIAVTLACWQREKICKITKMQCILLYKSLTVHHCDCCQFAVQFIFDSKKLDILTDNQQ